MNFAVIGDPIAHSFSPVIHHINFELNNDLFHYEKLHVSKDDLSDIKNIMIKKKLDGINVTVPHKENIIQFLDEIDGHAKEIQAVNTVKRVGDVFYGYNTDVEGYKQTILDQSFRHDRVLILGAGGAAKAVRLAHEELGSDVTIVARRKESFNTFKSNNFNALTIDEFTGGEFDIVINATPLGLNGEDAFKIFKLDQLINLKETVGYDLIYNPETTPFMTHFNMNFNGLEMLVNQAMLSYKIWTKKNVKLDDVKRKVRHVLKENNE